MSKTKEDAQINLMHEAYQLARDISRSALSDTLDRASAASLSLDKNPDMVPYIGVYEAFKAVDSAVDKTIAQMTPIMGEKQAQVLGDYARAAVIKDIMESAKLREFIESNK